MGARVQQDVTNIQTAWDRMMMMAKRTTTHAIGPYATMMNDGGGGRERLDGMLCQNAPPPLPHRLSTVSTVINDGTEAQKGSSLSTSRSG